MTWFKDLTGCSEDSPEDVRQRLFVDSEQLHSRVNDKSWRCGRLEISSLEELRSQVRKIRPNHGPIAVSEVVANVQHLHEDSNNAHAVFQVASQFNLLEMSSPGITPECGVGIYEEDWTQGPACAIAAGAGTIFRNYFASVNGRIGQNADNQIDCLSGVGNVLGNTDDRLWKMVNGYVFPSESGLNQIQQSLANMDDLRQDQVRQALQVGIQWDTQVTLHGASHIVTQVYCSALPVAYNPYPARMWTTFATLILEAAYEATICSAIINRHRHGNNRLYLTLLGGGVFGNDPAWILSAIHRALNLYAESGLDIAIVSFGESKPLARHLVKAFA